MTVRVNKSSFNIREKLSELERPIGLKGSELMRAETAQDAFSLIGAGRRNMIINGRFLVSQRGTYTSLTTPTSNTYYLDRWFWNGTINGNSQIQLKTDQVVNGFTNLNTYYYTSSNTIASSGQIIEASLWSHLKGKKVTYSAWVKTNNPRVGLRFYTGVQNYGPRHSGSGNWEYLTWTFTIPSGATNLYPLVDSYNGVFNDGSNTYIEITMVQVEEGTIATPFEHRSYGEELALCQRYFQKFDSGRFRGLNAYPNVNLTSGDQLPSFLFPVQFRATPTMSPATATAVYDTWAAGAGITRVVRYTASSGHVLFQYNSTDGGNQGSIPSGGYFRMRIDSNLEFSAEL